MQKNLYEKIKKLKKKDIKESSKVLQNRIELKAKSSELLKEFKELINEQEKYKGILENYQNLENKINEIRQKKQLYQNRNINISELDINIPDHVMGHFLNINKVINIEPDPNATNLFLRLEDNNRNVRNLLRNIISQNNNDSFYINSILSEYEKNLSRELSIIEDQKNRSEKKLRENNEKIYSIIIYLRMISDYINAKAMNNNIYKNEQEYIEKLLENSSDKNTNKKKWEEMKNIIIIIIILKTTKKQRDELDLNESDLMTRIRNMVK